MKNFTEFTQELEELFGLGKKKNVSINTGREEPKQTFGPATDNTERDKAKLQRLMAKASSPRGLKPEEKQELNKLKGKYKDYLAKKQQRSQKTAQRTKQ